jgi:hypothetical protein
VETGLAQEFDRSNPINLYIKQRLIEGKVLNAQIEISDKKSRPPGERWDGKFTLKEITAVNSILFLNRFNTKSAIPSKVKKYEPKADRFWRMINEISGIKNPSIPTVATQTVILKALANLYYLLNEGKDANEDHVNTLVEGVSSGRIDFSHTNPLWRFYKLEPAERAKLKNRVGETPADYLPEKGAPIIGEYDDKLPWMQFSTQHNSIFPMLGDLIRWQLCLPKRARRDTEKKNKRGK